MIPSATEIIEVESTLESDEVFQMDIARNSLTKVMRVLSGLYKDKETALLREYGCNARDSHIEAGNPMPIEVTTPTILDQVLRIKDYGVGLTKDDFRDIYSQYGSSTKDDNNEVTGSLGFGCKSALAYTHQFTVVAIKDGRQITISVSKNEEGVGAMTVVEESDTEEGNGVEIIIPANREHSFGYKARRLFRFWPKGTVLVDGQEVEPLEGLNVGTDMKLVDQTLMSNGQSYVIMGGNPYPIDSEHFDFALEEEYALVATVPMGSVHFLPSREELDYTKMTKRTLDALKVRFETELTASINKEVDAATTMPDALRVALKWRDALGERAVHDLVFTYKGVPLPQRIEAAKDGEVFIATEGPEEHDWDGKRIRVGAHHRHHNIDLAMVTDAIWVHGFVRTFTPACKRKLWLWCDQNSRDYPTTFIMCESKPTSPWIDTANIIPWQPVEDLKLPRYSKKGGHLMNPTGRIPGSYDLWICADGDLVHDEGVPADDIDQSFPVYYTTGESKSGHSLALTLAQIEDEFTLVELRSNRIAKFCRNFPQAKRAWEVLKEYHAEWWNEILTDFERMLLKFGHGHGGGGRYNNRFDYVPRVGVLDPDVKRWAKLHDTLRTMRYTRLDAMAQVFRTVAHIPEWFEDNPLDRYPLFETSHYSVSRKRIRQHNKVYLNAAYQAFYSGATSDA